MSTSGSGNGNGSRVIWRNNAYWVIGSDGNRRYQEEPDVKRNEGEDPLVFAREKLNVIEEYNQLYGSGNHNPFTRPAIQAYTLIKTLPHFHPWVLFRWTYWKLLVLFMATPSLLNLNESVIDNIDKNLIRWEGTPEEVLEEMERAKQAASLQDMGRDAQYWIDMYNRIATVEYQRRRGGRVPTPPNSAASMVPPQPQRSGDSATSMAPPQSRNSRGSSDDSGGPSGVPGVVFRGSNSWMSDPDYIPETPSSSSEDSGYAYDPYNIL
ncbi:uncharacterized protein LOC125493487 [Beta vulgaris subsp. vulgaris]|uniref:uncharacterized protein LOC125493487 n=1 Tax=Beta vulgaris subsp. vulgaris TaxID=3555 RepID=UPI0020371FA2|nr:uncharacterized protein LOC125493487 [Beta vulgaris subsp. vulgaris]